MSPKTEVLLNRNPLLKQLGDPAALLEPKFAEAERLIQGEPCRLLPSAVPAVLQCTR